MMKNNLKEIQVFYSFLYLSYVTDEYYESVYYFLWQHYRTIVRDLYIGKSIISNGEKCTCTDVVSFNGSLTLCFRCDNNSGSFSLNVYQLEGINFE